MDPSEYTLILLARIISTFPAEERTEYFIISQQALDQVSHFSCSHLHNVGKQIFFHESSSREDVFSFLPIHTFKISSEEMFLNEFEEDSIFQSSAAPTEERKRPKIQTRTRKAHEDPHSHAISAVFEIAIPDDPLGLYQLERRASGWFDLDKESKT